MLSTTIVDPFVDFSVADAEPRGNAWYAARAPPIVHLTLVLQDSRLLWVEAPALDSPEEGLILLVLLLIATVIEILGAGVIQSCEATLARLLGTITKLWRQRQWLVATLNRSNLWNWRSGCEASLVQGSHILLTVAIHRFYVNLLDLLALRLCISEERWCWLVKVAAWMSLKELADTGKSNWYLRGRLLFSLDTLTGVHLASELSWWKVLLQLISLFSFWALHGTHHGLFRLYLCLSLEELCTLWFWIRQRMLCASDVTRVLFLNKKINQRDAGNILAFDG